MAHTTPVRRLRSRITVFAAALLAACPALARAQAFTWQVPAGGETWTAGTTHTVAWSGGPVGVNVNVFLISLSPYQVVGPVALNNPYPYPASWALPGGLTPGSYQLYIEDVGSTTYAYSQTFSVRPAPVCHTGCSAVVVVPEWFSGYPGTSCGTTSAIALNNAQAWLANQLAAACTNGGTIDPSSVTSDYTFLPTGVCYVGEFGPFQVEATAVACCCSGATDVTKRSWGTLKVRYR